MVQKSLFATVFTLFFTINTSIADLDRENPLKEDVPFGIKFNKILSERDIDQLRKLNPQLLETLDLRLYRQRELAKLRNLLMERQETNDIREINRDVEDPLLQLISDWMRREEMKRKRAHHRALCHFKICNMGTKRSNTWDVWPNDNQVTSLSNF